MQITSTRTGISHSIGRVRRSEPTPVIDIVSVRCREILRAFATGGGEIAVERSPTRCRSGHRLVRCWFLCCLAKRRRKQLFALRCGCRAHCQCLWGEHGAGGHAPSLDAVTQHIQSGAQSQLRDLAHATVSWGLFSAVRRCPNSGRTTCADDFSRYAAQSSISAVRFLNRSPRR